jgi:hypothetical protein
LIFTLSLDSIFSLFSIFSSTNPTYKNSTTLTRLIFNSYSLKTLQNCTSFNLY